MVPNIRSRFVIFLFSACLITSALWAKQAPSLVPPGNLHISNTPQFIVLGWDDNSVAGLSWNLIEEEPIHSMNWALKMLSERKHLDGSPVLTTFYNNTSDLQPALKLKFQEAYEAGHEIANHTHGHQTQSTVEAWKSTLNQCTDALSAPMKSEGLDLAGIPSSEIVGFRAPFLAKNVELFTALSELNFLYDCSIEDGWQEHLHSRAQYFPYTLDDGISPELQAWIGFDIGKHPGLWELPVYPIFAPPDSLAVQYDVYVGFRDTLHARNKDFDPQNGKVTGFDYNVWRLYNMSAPEFLACLKFTLDERLKGNRAPMALGLHTQYYRANYATPNATFAERKKAIEDFIDYAVTKSEVRFATGKQVIEFMVKPIGLDGTSVEKMPQENHLFYPNQEGVVLNYSIPFTLQILNSQGKILSIQSFPAGKHQIKRQNQPRYLKIIGKNAINTILMTP